jgi:flagellar biosynthesis chaperone FliJ
VGYRVKSKKEIMKKIIFAAAVMMALSACNQAELDRSNGKNDSLSTVIKQREKDLDERETSLNEFINSFNEVERNLDCVAVRQKIVYSASESKAGDLKASQKDRINRHIEAINNLMDENRKTIAGLKKNLKTSRNKNKKLEASIATLTDRLAQKEQELNELNEKLNSLNAQLAQLQTKFDTLTAENGRQSQDITEKTTALHTAYYIVGKAKDLREAKIIDKKGGLLGIGKTDRLNDGFDKSKFTRIDYTETSSIPVYSDKVKIVTNHPPDSYRLEKIGNDKDKVSNLVITDAEKFWSVSKFLVVEGNPVNKDNGMASKASSKSNNY